MVKYSRVGRNVMIPAKFVLRGFPCDQKTLKATRKAFVGLSSSSVEASSEKWSHLNEKKDSVLRRKAADAMEAPKAFEKFKAPRENSFLFIFQGGGWWSHREQAGMLKKLKKVVFVVRNGCLKFRKQFREVLRKAVYKNLLVQALIACEGWRIVTPSKASWDVWKKNKNLCLKFGSKVISFESNLRMFCTRTLIKTILSKLGNTWWLRSNAKKVQRKLSKIFFRKTFKNSFFPLNEMASDEDNLKAVLSHPSSCF